MMVAEALKTVRYVVDTDNERTDVLVPLTAWETLLASWEAVVALLEDQEDSQLLREWLEQRAAGEIETMPLDDLEQELIADGLL